MNKRIFLTLVLFASYVANTFAYTVQEFKTDLNDFNRNFIIPIVVAGIFIYAIITGIPRSGKIRRGGDEATDAIVGWLMGLMWPVIVIVGSEILIIIYSKL